jgi:hypothetical protein
MEEVDFSDAARSTRMSNAAQFGVIDAYCACRLGIRLDSL